MAYRVVILEAATRDASGLLVTLCAADTNLEAARVQIHAQATLHPGKVLALEHNRWFDGERYVDTRWLRFLWLSLPDEEELSSSCSDDSSLMRPPRRRRATPRHRQKEADEVVMKRAGDLEEEAGCNRQPGFLF